MSTCEDDEDPDEIRVYTNVKVNRLKNTIFFENHNFTGGLTKSALLLHPGTC